MQASKQACQHLDTRLPVAARVASLIAQMTLREKISQMLNAAPPIPRLGIPAHNWWNECLHGVARAGKATVFPQAIGMAAAFNPDLLFTVASAISDEARAKHHQAVRFGNYGIYFGLTFWTPNVNIFRDPRWGRGQETYGEDPYLTARMGVAFVKGLQGNHRNYLKLVATAKHFAVHSGPEKDRHVFNAVVSGRDFRETYLPAFQALVQEAGVQSVMGAYNRTYGEPCCGSALLLQKILREEWGFDGYVVSDCWALNDFHTHHKVTATPEETAALALKNGCDIECGQLYGALLAACQQGLVQEADIDRALQRLFTARFKLGMFDPAEQVPYAQIRPEVVNCGKHKKLARRMACESLVLLKNNGILPLGKELRNIAVVGPTAMNPVALLGNYTGFAPQMTSILEGILGKVAPGTQVAYHKGCEVTGGNPTRLNPKDGVDVLPAKDIDVIIAAVGYTAELEGEEGCTEGDGDRGRYGLPGHQQQLIELLHQMGKPLILVVTAGSPVDLTWAAEHADAILLAWYPGEEGGNAVADVLFGDYNPAGRLPITFVKSYDQLPDFSDYNMAGRTYRFMQETPLYPFGYGLSYTTFAYSNLRLSRKVIGVDEAVTVSVDVRNSGKRDGDEVVQFYVSAQEASVPVPVRHLEGFKRVHLKAGAKTTVCFTLRPAQRVAYAEDGSALMEPGRYQVSVGGGQPGWTASRCREAVLRVRAS
jgi:beta-glucosidase